MLERLHKTLISSGSYFSRSDEKRKNLPVIYFPVPYSAIIAIQYELMPLLAKIKSEPNLYKRWISMIPKNLPISEVIPFSIATLKQICGKMPSSSKFTLPQQNGLKSICFFYA